MWKRKNPVRITTPKMQNETLSPITSDIEASLNRLPEYVRKECMIGIKNIGNYPKKNTTRAIIPTSLDHKKTSEETKTNYKVITAKN
jgi:hypothetical protein